MPQTLILNSKVESTKEAQARLRAQLQSLDVRRFKMAALGGEPESEFEQTFASLGYSFLKDKAPRLLDFIVGFQLVERDQDNTKAMGCFGFKVGDQWLYAPIVFVNGDLKGHELLYDKSRKIFVPLKENWVNYYIAKQPHTLGEPSDKSTHQLGGIMPNLARMAIPPMNGKWASAADATVLPEMAAWSLPFLRAFAKVAVMPVDALPAKVAAAFEPLDMRRWLRSLPVLKAAHVLSQAYPLIKVGFDRFYGAQFLLKQAQQLKEAESFMLPPTNGAPSRGATARRSKMGKKPMDSLLGEHGAHKEAAALPTALPTPPALVIYTYDGQNVQRDPPLPYTSPLFKAAAEEGASKNKVDNDKLITENLKEVTEEEQQRLLRDTVLIKDKRDPHGVSSLYNTQVRMALTNPSETGIYEVLEKPGKFDTLVLIHNPYSGRGGENFALVFRKSDPRAWLNVHRGNLWVREGNTPSRADFTKYVDGLGHPDKLEKGATYVAFDERGTGTCPFTVRESYDDGDTYRVNWHDHCDHRQQRPRTLPYQLKNRSDEYDYFGWDAKIHINRKAGAKLRPLNSELTIPATFKIVKLKSPPKDEESLLCCSPFSSENEDSKRPIQPGNLIDIQMMLHEKTAELRVHDTGAGEVWLHSRRGAQRFTKKAALLELVRAHGLREASARAVLKEAAACYHRNESASFRIKYASSLQPGPDAPNFPPPMTGMDQVSPRSEAVPTIYPQEDFLPVDSMSSYNTDPSIYDPFYKPDKNMQMVAQQASQSGDKELFDVSMFKSMLKAVRAGGLFTEGAGNLMRTVNELGETYLKLLWHHEEAEERYGKHDLPELVDSVRNTFDSLGDVLLFLKEKEVGDADELGGSVGNSAEPSIDEASRS